MVLPGQLGGRVGRRREFLLKPVFNQGWKRAFLYLIDIPWKVYLNTFDLAFQLRRKGVTIPYTDILIAATAQAHEATLLHVDAHFDLAAQFSSLKVESYVGKI